MKQKKKYLQKQRHFILYEDLNEPIFSGLNQIGFRKYVIIKHTVVNSWSFKDIYFYVFTKNKFKGNDAYIYPNFRFSYIYVSSIDFINTLFIFNFNKFFMFYFFLL
jgi:hypothetical protein